MGVVDRAGRGRAEPRGRFSASGRSDARQAAADGAAGAGGPQAGRTQRRSGRVDQRHSRRRPQAARGRFRHGRASRGRWQGGGGEGGAGGVAPRCAAVVALGPQAGARPSPAGTVVRGRDHGAGRRRANGRGRRRPLGPVRAEPVARRPARHHRPAPGLRGRGRAGPGLRPRRGLFRPREGVGLPDDLARPARGRGDDRDPGRRAARRARSCCVRGREPSCVWAAA